MEILDFIQKTIVLPFKQAYKIQQRLQHVVEKTAESTSSALSQRAFEIKVREEQMHLDHLEEHGQCCVCLQQGSVVPGRRKHDGGMKILEGQDAAILSAALGISVRGYLCPTCDVIRTKLKTRLQAKQAQRSRDEAARSGGGAGHVTRLAGTDGTTLAVAHEAFLAGAGLGRTGMAAGPLSEGLFRGITAWPTDKPLDIGIVAAPDSSNNNDGDDNHHHSGSAATAGVRILPTDSVVLVFRARDLVVVSDRNSSKGNSAEPTPLSSSSLVNVQQPPTITAAAATLTVPSSVHHHHHRHHHRKKEDFEVYFRLSRLLPGASMASLLDSENVVGAGGGADVCELVAESEPVAFTAASSSHHRTIEWPKTQAIPITKLCGRDCASSFVFEVLDKSNDRSVGRCAFRMEDLVQATTREQVGPVDLIAKRTASNSIAVAAAASTVASAATVPSAKPQRARNDDDDDDSDGHSSRSDGGDSHNGGDHHLQINVHAPQRKHHQLKEDEVRTGVVYLTKIVVHRYIPNIPPPRAAAGAAATTTATTISSVPPLDHNDEQQQQSQDGAMSVAPSTHTSTPQVPAWAIAALHKRTCDICHARGVELFHRKYRELLCGVCRAARRHPRDCIPIDSAMPDRASALSLTMTVLASRPRVRDDPTYKQPMSLFPAQEVPLFLVQNLNVSSSNSNNSDSSSSSATGYSHCYFSQADGLLSEGADVGDARRLRAETLFAGKRVEQKVVQQQPNLFDEYWRAEVPADTLKPVDLLDCTLQQVAKE